MSGVPHLICFWCSSVPCLSGHDHHYLKQIQVTEPALARDSHLEGTFALLYQCEHCEMRFKTNNMRESEERPAVLTDMRLPDSRGTMLPAHSQLPMGRCQVQLHSLESICLVPFDERPLHMAWLSGFEAGRK